jgi:ribosomal protein S18 acetylase RimI-like enzyme
MFLSGWNRFAEVLSLRLWELCSRACTWVAAARARLRGSAGKLAAVVRGCRPAASGAGADRGASELEAIGVGRLAPIERPAAVDLLARAFRDNPLNLEVIDRGPAARVRSNAHGARASLRAAEGSALLLAAREGAPSRATLAGVLLAVAPFDYPLPLPPPLVQLRCLLGQGIRTARRWARVHREFAAVHPAPPHWYLGALGVDPRRQRRGVGSALLREWLCRIDAENAPSYLETDRPENVAFYRRAGFEVTGELRIMEVRVWCMWRSPRDSAGSVGDAPARRA